MEAGGSTSEFCFEVDPINNLTFPVLFMLSHGVCPAKKEAAGIAGPRLAPLGVAIPAEEGKRAAVRAAI